jgi:hypothetical protein
MSVGQPGNLSLIQLLLKAAAPQMDEEMDECRKKLQMTPKHQEKNKSREMYCKV